jgi:hypothetical protein
LATANATANTVSVFFVHVGGFLEPLPLTGSTLTLGGGASGPTSVAWSALGGFLATANAASNNMSVFQMVDCTSMFNSGFQAGFNASYNHHFNAVFSAAYGPHGGWDLGFTRGYEAARGHRAHDAGGAARMATARSAATDLGPRSQTPAQAACDPVFNAAFNDGFNTAFNAAFNDGFNAAFNNGYRAGSAAGGRP